MKSKSKEFVKKITAWVLTLVMVLSLVMVPAGEVKAAENLSLSLKDGTSIPTVATASNNIEILFAPNGQYTTLKALNDAGYTKLRITINIGAYTAKNGETPGLMPFVVYGETWTNNKVWSNLTSTGQQTVELDLSAISTTNTETIGHFGIQVANITGNISCSDVTAELVASGSGSSGDTSGFGTTRDYSSGMTAVVTNQDTPSNDWSGFNLTITNNSGSSICDWIVVMQLPSGAASKFKCWNATFVADGDTIYLYPAQNGGNAVVGASATVAPGAGFGISSMLVDASNITVKGVYFNKGTSSSIDYSSGDTNDENSNSGGGGSTGESFDGSNIGTIDTSLDYNFAKLLQLSLYFYDANMCGDKVDETSLYSKDLYNGWRDDCHINDYFMYNGTKYTVTGGYHDAGDHVKFGLPMAQSMTTLGIAYDQFGDAFDELNQTSHLKTITDYYCDYVRSCTVLNAAGDTAEAFCYQVGDGQADHKNWCPPEVENESSTNRTFTYVATSSNPATDIVSEAAAALAMNYLNFKNTEDLKYAKALFAFAKSIPDSNKKVGTYQPDGYGGNFYASNSWKDDYCLAAALLYKATNNVEYKNEYNSKNENSGNISKPFDWDNVYQAAAYYAPEISSSEMATMKSYFDSKANSSSSNYFCPYSWGSARYNCNVQMMSLIYDNLYDTSFKTWARYQMSAILGNNSKSVNLVCGYNTNSAKKPHHRASSGFANWDAYNADGTHKYTLYGALVGGPTSSDFSSYEDSITNYTTNEITCDYNAGLVGAAAALYTYYKDCNEEGYNDQAILADFYGGSNFAGGAEEVLATSLSLQDAITLTKGNSATVSVAIEPANTTNKDLTWNSSDTNVATVDSNGKVTAKASGTTTITATTKDGSNLSDTCTVTVTNPVTAFALDQSSVTVAKGDETTVTCIVTPSDADAYTITCSSSNPSVATANVSGNKIIISGVAKGDGTIITVTLTRTADGATFTKTCTVNVTVPLTGISLNKTTLNLVKGANEANETLTVTPSPVDASTSGLVWSSSNNNVATVNNGKVTAVGNGTATITAKIGNISASCTVNVTTSVTGVSLNKTSLELEKGASSTLVATVAPTDASNKNVIWKSSDSNVATVDSSGKVTAKGVGTATVTVTTVDGEKTATCTVTVKKLTPTISGANQIEVTAGNWLHSIGTTNYQAAVNGGNINGSFTWKESNKEITYADNNTTYTLVFTPSDTSTYNVVEKEITLVVNRKPCDPPAAPTLVSKTANSVTLTTYSGAGTVKYGCKKGSGSYTWQTSPVFTNLSAYTTYRFAMKYVQNDIYSESDASNPLEVTTYFSDEDCLVVDLAKLEDSTYITAHNGAISYDIATKTLSLSRESTYTIEGVNEEVTISCGNATIVMWDVSCKAIDATGNVSLQLDGTNTVKAGITSAQTVTIGNAGATVGKLTVTGGTTAAVEADKIVVNSGQIIATGTGSNPALKADAEIRLLGGTVTANGETTSIIPIDASQNGTIVLEGCQVQSNAIETYSKTPVNTKGEAVNLCDVTYKDGDNVLSNYKATIGTTITLDNLDEKSGYKMEGWKQEGGVNVMKPGATVEVTGDVTFIAVYTKITGELQIKAEDGVEPLTVGYSNDEGVKVTITNNTNVTIDQVTLTLNSTNYFTLSESTITSLLPGVSKDVYISMKSGLGANEYNVTMTASCKEVDSKTIKVTRKVVSKAVEEEDEDVILDEPIEKEEVVKKVESITIQVPSFSMMEDTTATATAVILPADATDKSIAWSSTDPTVATVTEAGMITAVSPGTAQIIASAKDGSNKSASITITVVESPEADDTIKASAMLVTADVKKADDIPVKGTMQLAPKMKMQINVAFLPEDAEEEELTFTSSNPKIATIDEDGLIKAGKKAGKTTITITSENGLKKSFTLQVMKTAVKKIKIKVSKKSVKVKKKLKLKATVTPGKKEANASVYWISNKPNIATVTQSGVVKGIKKGKVKITAVAKDGSGKKATVTIQVK